MKQQLSLTTFLQILLLLALPFASAAQDDKSYALVEEGIQLHDEGNYQGAISKYNAAIAIDKKNPYAYYELSLTYYTIEMYSKALKYVNKATKYAGDDNDLKVSCYLLKAAIYEDDKQAAKAIKTYKKAIKKYPNYYLLRYNLAYSYYLIDEYDDAEKELMMSLSLNFRHASSHLLLGYVAGEQGMKSQAMIALSHFLFLENLEHPVNITDRAENALDFYKKVALSGVTTSESSGRPEITINISGGMLNPFMITDLTLAMAQADQLKKADSLNLTKLERLEGISLKFFETIAEAKPAAKRFWATYVGWYAKMQEEEVGDAFVKITLLASKDEDVIAWINEHSDDIKALESEFFRYYEKE